MKYIKDLVSVVIPTYRRNDSLRCTIRSVLNQTYSNIEVLVVNDNISRDDEYSQQLYQIIRCLNDDRVTLIEQERHINGAAARNAGIHAAKGEFIAFLDDDDDWEKTKISKQVDVLKQLDESWGAASCLTRHYKNEKLIMCCLPYRSGNLLIDVLERRIGLGTGALLIRRSALDDCAYFDEKLKRHQDLQLFAFLTAKYKIYLVKEYLYNKNDDDAQNRPGAEDLIAIKKEYFVSISSVMGSLKTSQQNVIQALHEFEIAYAFYKEHKFMEALCRTKKILRSPKTVLLAVERIVRRLIEKRFRYALEKKFSRD